MASLVSDARTRPAVLELRLDTIGPPVARDLGRLLVRVADNYSSRFPNSGTLCVRSVRQGSLLIDFCLLAGGVIVAVNGANSLIEFVKHINDVNRFLRVGSELESYSDRALAAGIRMILAHGGSIEFRARGLESEAVAAIHAAQIAPPKPKADKPVKGGKRRGPGDDRKAPGLPKAENFQSVSIIPVRIENRLFVWMPGLFSEALPASGDPLLADGSKAKIGKHQIKEAIQNAVAGRSRLDEHLGSQVLADVTVLTWPDGRREVALKRLVSTRT